MICKLLAVFLIFICSFSHFQAEYQRGLQSPFFLRTERGLHSKMSRLSVSNNIDVLRSHLVSFLTAGRVRRIRQVTRNQEPLWHYLNRRTNVLGGKVRGLTRARWQDLEPQRD